MQIVHTVLAFVLLQGATRAQPSNDNCADAIDLSNGVSISGDTSDASIDSGLEEYGTSISAPGLWYKFVTSSCPGTLDFRQDVTVSLCDEDTNFDTKMTIYKGSSCGALECVAGQDDDSSCEFSTLHSEISLDMPSQSETYYVLVHGFGGNTGQFDVTLTETCTPVPTNDLCTGAIELSSGVSISGDTTDASIDSGLEECGTSISAPGLWYKFETSDLCPGRLTITESVLVSLCDQDTNYDTKMTIYKGSSCGALECVTGQDDSSCNVDSLQSEISLDMPSQSETYYVLVHGFGGNTGQFDVTLTEECTCTDPGGCGDPHFKTWSGDWYDFHAACDLELITVPDFGNGLGLTVYIRTTGRYQYSYIESAAIKIGDDILEVSSYGSYIFGGVSAASMPATFADQYPVAYERTSEKEHKFVITIGDTESIIVSTFKDLVSVRLANATEATFAQSVGLMGNYYNGALLGRDGTAVFHDHDAFGQEWQVRETDPKLFQTSRFPQHPESCVPPGLKQEDKRRRLGESIVEEAAQAACAHWGDNKHLCMYDVMATGDLELAQAGAY